MLIPQHLANVWLFGGRCAILGAIVCALGIVGGRFGKERCWANTLLSAALACSTEVIATTDCNRPNAERAWEKITVDPVLRHWKGERTRISDACEQSVRRQCALVDMLDDSTDQQFAQARQRLQEEQATFASLKAQEDALKFDPRSTPLFIKLGLADALTTVIALWLLVLTGRRILEKRGKRLRRGWLTPAIAFSAIGSALAIVAMCVSAFGQQEKLWFGIDSYVVCKGCWWGNMVATVGVVIMFAQPMTLLWLLTRRDCMPKKGDVKPLAPRGDSNVGDYVTFLHTWAILGVALTLVPAVLFIRQFVLVGNAFSPYLLPVFGGLALTATLVIRIVLNAIELRSRYQAALAELGDSWQSVQGLNPAPDPTVSFIGENWWKLPATFASMLLAFWTLLEWLGVAKTLAEAVSK